MFYVNECCYIGMDYQGDPDLPLPADAQWGNIGMSSVFFYVSNFYFLIYMVFL